MGGFGRCCCGCECLVSTALPTMTIGGMTGSGWNGITCCFEQIFDYNTTPSASTVTTAPVWQSNFTRDRTQQILARSLPAAHLYSAPAPDFCPLPEEECCPPANVLVGEINEQLDETKRLTFKVVYAPSYVRLKYSKQLVDCYGTERCKYVLQLTIFYNYNYYYEVLTDSSRTVESLPGVDCFECVGPDDNDLDCSFTESVTDIPGAYSEGAGSFQIDRVKYFDSPPTGTVTFTGSDIDECDETLCSTDGNYVSQVCIQSSIEEGFELPCWCASVAVDLTQITYDISGECQLYGTVYEGCNGVGPCLVSATLCDPIEMDCVYTADCSAIEYPSNCNDPVFTGVGLSSSWVYGGDSIPFITDCCISTVTTLCTGYPFQAKSNCEETVVGQPEDCDSDCCHSYHSFEDSCLPCSLFIVNCAPRYGSVNRTITADTITKTCTGPTQRSVCINGPTSFQVTVS